MILDFEGLLKRTSDHPLSSDALLKQAIEQAIRNDSHDEALVKDLKGLLHHYLLQLSVREQRTGKGSYHG